MVVKRRSKRNSLRKTRCVKRKRVKKTNRKKSNRKKSKVFHKKMIGGEYNKNDLVLTFGLTAAEFNDKIGIIIDDCNGQPERCNIELKEKVDGKYHTKAIRKTNFKHSNKEYLTRGTHGVIYINTFDESTRVLVEKQFDNRPSPKLEHFCEISYTNLCETPCLCDSIKYEYHIHEIIYNKLAELNFSIIPPKVYFFNYESSENKCSYFMDYIHPALEGYSDVKLNLYEADYDGRESERGSDVVLGLNKTEGILDDKSKAVRDIGMLFGILHYLLRIDGFDCEIIIGSDRKLYIIDFDKCNCFNFNPQEGSYIVRKYDEQDFVKRSHENLKQISRTLFTAMTSMNLVPKDPEYKSLFITGYDMPGLEGNALEINRLVQGLINEY